MVPAAMIQLDKPDTALRQTPGQQAVRGEGTVARSFDSILLQRTLFFFCHVGEFGHGRLHLEG